MVTYVNEFSALVDNKSTECKILAIKDNSKPSIAWNETIQVLDKWVPFKIDTGSDVNLMSHEIFKKLKPKPKLVPSKIKLSSYTGHVISVLGSSDIQCAKNGKQMIVKFFVTSLNTENVLGLKACIDFGLVAKIPTPVEVHSAEKVVKLFADVFSPQEVLRCKPYHLDLVPNTKPPLPMIYKKIALSLKAKMQNELHRMMEYGLIEPVKESATAWSFPSILLTTANESLSIFLDCRHLNKFIIADYYPLPTIDDALCTAQYSQYFSILSSPNACTQIPLDESSSYICTMATPCGKYKLKTIPYGLSNASIIFHFIATEIFHDIDGVVVYIEDILVHGKTKDEHNNRLTQVLERARKYNLKFSKARLDLAKAELKFMGRLLSRNGVMMDDASHTEAIKYLPVPVNKQDLQRFVDMMGSLHVSLHCSPLKKLLEKSEKFVWGKDQEVAYYALKNSICEAPILKVYAPSKTLHLTVSASSIGLGAVALQDGHPLGYYSTALDNVQQKYPQIEKKLLAILSALEHFHFYTYSKEVVVQSDHRPLVTLIKEPLEMMSPRTQIILVKLMRFHFKLEYVAGKDLVVAQILSKHPLKQYHQKETPTEPAYALLCATEERIADFKQSLKEDSILQHVISYIREGWPKYPSWIKNEAKKYFGIKEELRFTGELLFCNNQLVVPEKQKPNVLKQLHAVHQSLKACLERAKLVYYWPTMIKDIEAYLSCCAVCQRCTKSTEENAVVYIEMPDLPWNKLGIDFVQVERKNFAMIIDYFSKFLIIKPVNVKTVKALIGTVEDIFAVHGLPLEIVSPNGPPFNVGEWKMFLKTYDIRHAMFLDAKGDTVMEKYKEIAKFLVKKPMGLFLAILEYNSTPTQNLPSPAELLMGRRLRTNLLVPTAVLMPNYDISKAVSTMQNKEKSPNDKKA